MKSLSTYAVLISFLLICMVRIGYHTDNKINGNNATSWDAFGYYLYLPATFIYQDVDKLEWVAAIDSKYHVTGGYYYQAVPMENGNYVCKYLGGVAIMELPFFALGHLTAKLAGYPQDGFSAPYQYAILWGAVFWFLFGMIMLRKVLLNYYSEMVTALTLLLLAAASNLIQYVAVSGAMSHAYIFPLYALILFYSMKWSESPKFRYAFIIGIILGLATISRPTELIMLFIPLFWLAKRHANFKDKWKEILNHKTHLLLTAVGFFIAILPQLIYWKYVTGSWIYDVGSKWNFHNPWWRVLFGFEKGWFIYTPVALLFVAGLFFLKSKPFRLAVIIFCILNIWIVISWHEWRYGASYSTRALTQSYPVFSLACAALIERLLQSKLKVLLYVGSVYFTLVNLFQIWQYNNTMLHYDDMNANYYRAIYLDADPSPLDYSLLDTDELLSTEEQKNLRHQFEITYSADLITPAFPKYLATYIPSQKTKAVDGLLEIRTKSGLHNGTLVVQAFVKSELVKQKEFRLALPFKKDLQMNTYRHHFFIHPKMDSVVWSLHAFDTIKLDQAVFTVSTFDN